MLHEQLLHVQRFQQARESRLKDVVHSVGVVESHHQPIYLRSIKIAEQCRRDGTHALAVATGIAVHREAMKDVEQRSLSISVASSEQDVSADRAGDV